MANKKKNPGGLPAPIDSTFTGTQNGISIDLSWNIDTGGIPIFWDGIQKSIDGGTTWGALAAWQTGYQTGWNPPNSGAFADSDLQPGETVQYRMWYATGDATNDQIYLINNYTPIVFTV